MIAEFLEALRVHWGIILTVAGLIASVFWLKMDSRYAKKGDVHELEVRIGNAENAISHLPSANDINDLRVALVEMKGEAKELRAETKILRHQVGLLLEAKVLKE